MNSEELFDAITDILEDILEEAREHKPKNRARLWRRVIAAAAAVVVVFGLCAWENTVPGRGRSASVSHMLTQPEESDPPLQIQVSQEPLSSEPWSYTGPKAVSLAAYSPLPEGQNWGLGADEQKAHQQACESWLQEIGMRQPVDGYEEGLEHFLRTSIPVFLTDMEENQVYSPVGSFMTLGMLAETTRGESCRQLLALLGVSNLEDLREKARNVWHSCYNAGESAYSVVANSLWLNESIAYRQSVMDTLTSYYYASSFQGNMGSTEYTEMLRQWINAQTDGDLRDSMSRQEFAANTAINVISAIRFYGEWDNPFNATAISHREFYGTQGTVMCDFLFRGEGRTYYRGKRFGAVTEPIIGGYQMWFILPDEGFDLAQLLSDGDVFEFIVNNQNWRLQEKAWVNFLLPKFEVTSQLDLSEGLKTLGVTDVFYEEKADFSAMAQGESKNLVLTQIIQETRVGVDEFGVSVGSLTRGEVSWRSGGQRNVNFFLDRPFIFFITNAEGLPLFVGIVNQV